MRAELSLKPMLVRDQKTSAEYQSEGTRLDFCIEEAPLSY